MLRNEGTRTCPACNYKLDPSTINEHHFVQKDVNGKIVAGMCYRTLKPFDFKTE